MIIGTCDTREVTVYPESDRVGVMALGRGLDGAASIDCWDGIDVDDAVR